MRRKFLIDSGVRADPSGPANQPPWLLAPAMTTMALFLLAPFLILAAYSLLEPTGAGSTGSWTLGNFIKLFLDPHYLGVIARTIWIALAVVSLTLVLGYALAFSIMSCAPRWRRLMLGLVVIPLLLSGVIRTFGWIVLLSRSGPLAGLLNGLRPNRRAADAPRAPGGRHYWTDARSYAVHGARGGEQSLLP